MSSINFHHFSLLTTCLYVLHTFLVVQGTPRRHMVVGIAVLRVIELLPHHVIQAAAVAVQDFLERFPKVSVQSGVNDRVE